MTGGKLYRDRQLRVLWQSTKGVLHSFCPSVGRWRRKATVIALACALAGLTGLVAHAQVTGLGSISGVVTDSGGAVIPNARISVSNVATNVAHASVTNSTGYFEVDDLNPGVYRISVMASGFEDLVREGITLEADARLSIPLKLQVGRAAQTVIVSADATLLNTQDESNGQVLTTRQLELLPSAGANPLQLAQMAPGIQSPNSQTYSMEDTLSWNGVSKFGTTGYLNANEYSLDGAPNMGNPRGNGVDLSQDEISEMKVETVPFDAAFGHTMGATVTQITKSGTNDLHGAVHELYQDKSWAAMQHFQGLNYRYEQAQNGCTSGDSSPQCLLVKYEYGQPGTHMNLYAGTLGGPVFIPKLYDGRNKFFFFVAVDGDSWIDDSVKNNSLPTVQERSGDFSDMPVTTTNIPAAFTSACGTGTPYYGQYQIYNPFSMTLDSKGIPRRTPFCGNVIPAGLMSTTSTLSNFYNHLLPAPTQDNPTGTNYTYTNGNLQYFHQFTQRMDYALSESDHLFFRWSRMHYSNDMSGFTIGDVDQNVGNRWVTIGSFGWNHVFSARTNLGFVGGASQYTTIADTYPGYEKYPPSSVGLPSYLNSYDGAAPLLPVLTITNYTGLGATNSAAQHFRTLSLGATLTHVQGSHTIRAGAEWEQQNYAEPAQGNTNGTYTFNDTYTEENNGTDKTYSENNTSLAYAAFLLGIPTTSSVAAGAPISINTPYYDLWVADTWRATQKLTINAGLRYEFEFGPIEKHNEQIVGWDPTASLPIANAANTAYASTLAKATAAQQAVLPSSLVIQGGPLYAGINGDSVRQFGNSYRVLPRFGIAYAITPKTVIRAGYGIFFDTINAHDASSKPTASISGATGAYAGFLFSTDQDGYSTSTSVASSTNYGANFVAGTSPLSNPFPTVNGTQFNPAVGNSAGTMYYAGSSPIIYDHGLVPPRAQRIYVGVQHQFGASTMIEVAYLGSYTTKLPVTVSTAHVPETFYTGGTQPNIADNTLLASLVTNPFAIGNFSGLSSSAPAAYGLISHSSYYTSSTISVANLVRGYPQMSGLSMYQSLGQSHFQEAQINLTKRYNQGLTLMAALQLNDQHDRNYYANPFDTSLSWQPSNNSLPYRFTAEGLYLLPFGHGQRWVHSGLGAAIVGGMQIGGSYELQPGPLLDFGNLFYLGSPGKDIKLKHPVYVNGQASGGYNRVQWLNPGNVTTTYSNGTCTYSGTGFVTNSQCQPNSYNLQVFPTRVNGVRSESTDTIQANVQRTFHLSERFSLETRIEAFNLLNRQVLGNPDLSPSDSEFGQITADGGVNQSGNGRWLNIQGRLRF